MTATRRICLAHPVLLALVGCSSVVVGRQQPHPNVGEAATLPIASLTIADDIQQNIELTDTTVIIRVEDWRFTIQAGFDNAFGLSEREDAYNLHLGDAAIRFESQWASTRNPHKWNVRLSYNAFLSDAEGHTVARAIGVVESAPTFDDFSQATTDAVERMWESVGEEFVRAIQQQQQAGD